MAARDIMPWKSHNGGTTTVKTASMTTGQTFEVGEPVGIVTAGTVTEIPQDESPWIIGDQETAFQCGIACFGPGAGNINPQTGVAFAAGDEVAFWPINEGTIFITSQFMNTGMTAAVVPVLTDIGMSYQISYSTAAPIGWGVEQTAGVAGVDVEARIVDVLDAQKAPITRSGQAGVHLIFELVAAVGAA